MGNGLADSVARLVAARLPGGYSIENRPGDEGHFGAEVVSKSEPDGYTLLFGPISLYAAGASIVRRHYDLEADFTAVTLLANAPHVLVAHPSLPVKAVPELIALAKSRPGQLRWASHGRTSFSQLELEMFRGITAVRIIPLPLATGAALTELSTGRADLLFESIATAMPQIKAGRLRAIAIAGSTRSPALRDVPTLAESGARNFEANYWYGILAPDGVPRNVLERQHADFIKAVAGAELREAFVSHGIEMRTSTPAETTRIIKHEIDKWSKVASAARARRD